jgi:hypothetical protein
MYSDSPRRAAGISLRNPLLFPDGKPPAVPTSPSPPKSLELRISQDLDTVTKSWTAEELAARRRVLNFSRRQTGHVITLSFTPIRTVKDAKLPNTYISCIWWESKQGHVVSTLDVVELVGWLVGQTLLETHRKSIRRDLEAHHNEMKNVRASDRMFFSTVLNMAFPKPRRPDRNTFRAIPWRELGPALVETVRTFAFNHVAAPGIDAMAPSRFGNGVIATGPEIDVLPQLPQPLPMQSSKLAPVEQILDFDGLPQIHDLPLPDSSTGLGGLLLPPDLTFTTSEMICLDRLPKPKSARHLNSNLTTLDGLPTLESATELNSSLTIDGLFLPNVATETSNSMDPNKPVSPEFAAEVKNSLAALEALELPGLVVQDELLLNRQDRKPFDNTMNCRMLSQQDFQPPRLEANHREAETIDPRMIFSQTFAAAHSMVQRQGLDSVFDNVKLDCYGAS